MPATVPAISNPGVIGSSGSQRIGALSRYQIGEINATRMHLNQQLTIACL
jgi:hypothetical protein